MTDTPLNRAGLGRNRRTERRSYVVLYALTFGLFLLVAILARLMPRRIDPFHSGGGARRSVLAEAQSAASATIGYAFMG
ncbi:MAG: hypothetical protein AAF739_04395 [Pseudomonadota bacterium]